MGTKRLCKFLRFFFIKIIVLFYCCTSYGQQNHFIYFQAENNQPFYVKLNKKIFNSSSSGYVIVPKLTDGNYNFQLGFPKTESPEQSFNYNINTKDVGFVIKNFPDKGWGLFNIQSMEVVMAGDAASSIVSNTTSIVQHTIKKISETQSDSSINLIFVDSLNEKQDTIYVSIHKSAETIQSVDTIQEKPKDSIISGTNAANIFLSTKSDSIANTIVQIDTTKKIPELPTVKTYNTKCKDFAVQEDFLKLRKKMAAQENEEDMISVAKKVFKSRCFTTEQVKNLSLLFLNNQGKYNFFDAAYPYVYDLYNFNSLQAQLTDEYSINRFKAMIKN